MELSQKLKEELSAHPIIGANIHNLIKDFEKAVPTAKDWEQRDYQSAFVVFLSGVVCAIDAGSVFNKNFVIEQT